VDNSVLFWDAGDDVKTIAAALDELAGRIARIPPPSARRPHAFHEERSEVASLARAIAEWHRTGRKPVDALEACNEPLRR
jgi:hypothetical protein